MTKAELITKLADYANDTQICIGIPDSYGGFNWNDLQDMRSSNATGPGTEIILIPGDGRGR